MHSTQPSLDHLPQVQQQMPSVGDLNGLRCTLANAVSKDASAVPGDDLNAWVGLQPRGQALGPPVGKQVDHAIALEGSPHDLRKIVRQAGNDDFSDACTNPRLCMKPTATAGPRDFPFKTLFQNGF